MQPVISVLAALSILFAAGCSDDGSRGDTANAGGADGEAAGGQGGEAADGEGGEGVSQGPVQCEDGGPATLIGGLGGDQDFGGQLLDPKLPDTCGDRYSCGRAGDDGGTADPVDVSAAFPGGLEFFGRSYDSVFINVNGNISFGEPYPVYMSEPFPAADLPMIAPFWANVDLTRHGETFDNNVWWAVDAGGGRLIVTWNEVGRVGSKVDLLNSFQLILSTTDDPGLGNFDVEFRYNRCEWHTGDGDSDAPVQIGFDAGDAQNYGNLGISRTEEALQVCCRSNVDNPGVWRFKMRDGVPAGASLLLHNGGEGEGDEGDEGEGAEGEGGEGEGGESEGDEGGGEGASLCDGSHEPGEIFCASANMRNQWDPECAFPFELPCDQGMVCHPPTAECVVQECNHNTSKCKDQHTRLFCNETGSAWLPPSPCAEGLVCVEVELNGFCAEVICQPGTLGCEDDETVKVCNDNGTDWVFEPCGQGQSCDEDDHACKDRICDPDATRCDDEDEQLIWVCDSVGISEEELVCPQDKRCQAGVCEFR